VDGADLLVGEVTDASVRLAEALKNRYTIERELGQPTSEMRSLRPFRASGLY
jgi:hypothetical protein